VEHAVNTFPISLLCAISGDEPLMLDSEDNLDEFIRKGADVNRAVLGLLEFVRLECFSTDVMNNFFDVILEPFYESNASM
jgi:hypothetical protein